MIESIIYSILFSIFIIFLLIIASIITYKKIKKHPEKNYEELFLRVKSWWIIVFLILISLYTDKLFTTIFWAFISFLALREFYSIIPYKNINRKIVFWSYFAIPIQFYIAYSGWYNLFIIFIPVYMLLFLPIRVLIDGNTKNFVTCNAISQWSLILCVFSLSHIIFLISLSDSSFHPKAGYIGLILFLLFLTALNDISQYISGKLFGNKKITPKISPNKTLEGLIGGIIITTFVGSILSQFLTILSLSKGIVASLLISIFGFFGDILVSSIKRNVRIKDSSNFIPGHGGILDRIDSLIYTSIIFSHFYYFSVN